MQRIGPTMILAALALAACGSDDGATVADAWSRASAPTQTLGAVYFDLTVPDDDRLIGASVPASISTRAEIHEVVMADDMEMTTDESMESSMEMSMDETDMSEGSDDMGDEMSGAMQMREMPDGLALTGGETVSFEPGGYHVMLPELAAPLEVGDEFDLTLDFENADDVTVTVEVAETAP